MKNKEMKEDWGDNYDKNLMRFCWCMMIVIILASWYLN